MNDQEMVQEVLQGHLTATKWPKPRLVKIFIASTKSDFVEERRQLLEIVGPELQSIFDQMGLEVELVDMHYGSEDDTSLDTNLFQDHLHEIRECHRVSRGCFFLCLVGNKYGPCPLSATLELDQYEAISSTARDLGLDADSLDTWYQRDDVTSTYVLQQPSDVRSEEWKATCCELGELIERAAHEMTSSESRFSAVTCRQISQSTVERQFHHALGIAPGTAHHILTIVRDWEKLEDNQPDYEDCDNEGKPHQRYRDQLKNFRDKLDISLPEENRSYLTVSWKPGGLDADLEEHDAYLNDFRDTVTNKLELLIKTGIKDEPEVKARNKTIQEVYQETLSHLTLCHQTISHPQTIDFTATDTLERIKTLMTSSYNSAPNVRHGPIIIHGPHGFGKTSIITSIYTNSESWFDRRLLRIVRFSSATPRSAYNLELLRVICQQLCLLLKLPEGFLPKDASFDPLYVNNWFQTLIRKFEEASSNELLLILIDDLHRLNPLDSDIVAGLSWLPISLPRNVHIVGTTSLTPEALKLTPVQRERFRGADCYIELPTPNTGGIPLVQQVESALDILEAKYGRTAIVRLGSFLTCTEFGLTETELLELLMPTSNSAATLSLAAGNFNFSTLCSIRRQMGVLLREKLMSGKMLIKWRHEITNEVVKKRYLQTQDALRAAHGEIANLFFSEFVHQENEEKGEETESEEVAPSSPTENKETPFQTTLPVDDVTYSLRHVEESWIHLLKAGDTNRLKQLTVCNFDFLLAAVQTVSVSYLRCILEHVRCFLLSRDLELVYYTIRKSSDVLTRDPLQLGAQIICWLRTHTDNADDLVSHMITSAMAWCDGYNAPLLVPLNGWLTPPLPLQIKSVHCPGGVKLIEPTPSGQHVVVVPQSGDPQLWHVMSNSLIHTFKGHSGPVLCLAITKQSQYLLTGSDDISIIVWDIKMLNLKLRIYEHIAPVLCLTPALGNSVIVSGGEDSRIIITSLLTGDVVMKIDHHRGPVTSVRANTAGDVLVSGPHRLLVLHPHLLL